MNQHSKINWNLATVSIGILTLLFTISSFSKDRETVYKTVCQVCHGTGVMDAPKYGDKAGWGDQINKRYEYIFPDLIYG